MMNKQQEKWAGEFGKEYTERNNDTPYGLEQEYIAKYGITRTEMNLVFLGEMSKDLTILDYGCNIGLQSALLKYIGFKTMWGTDINTDVLFEAFKKNNIKSMIYYDALGETLEFANIVFTSGVLIHQSPETLGGVINEMIRLSKEYIWGFEYYADKLTEIPYRGNTDMMWKGNYCDLFMDMGLELVKRKKYKRTDGNIDEMYLLRKVKS